MTNDTNQPIVVVSDIHLGINHIEGATPPDRDQFKNFLDTFPERLGSRLGTTPKHLVLNGDIDDLWRRNIRTLTRENYDIYTQLADLRERGIMIHYILGNHDWYAKRDRAETIDRQNVRYYDTNYKKRKTLTAYDTNYTFRHGYHFDKYILSFARAAGFSPPEDVFNVLAEFDGDIYGNHQERLWNRIQRIADPRFNPSQFNPLLKQLDVDEANRKRDLGIAPKGAMDSVRNDPHTDWLCLGHTHIEGIKSDPSSANSGVANSGSWQGEKSTFLVLDSSPHLWEWNDGDPVQLSE